jgi:hypothetical protein
LKRGHTHHVGFCHAHHACRSQNAPNGDPYSHHAPAQVSKIPQKSDTVVEGENSPKTLTNGAHIATKCEKCELARAYATCLHNTTTSPIRLAGGSRFGASNARGPHHGCPHLLSPFLYTTEKTLTVQCPASRYRCPPPVRSVAVSISTCRSREPRWGGITPTRLQNDNSSVDGYPSVHTAAGLEAEKQRISLTTAHDFNRVPQCSITDHLDNCLLLHLQHLFNKCRNEVTWFFCRRVVCLHKQFNLLSVIKQSQYARS